MADPNRALFESVVNLLAPILDELVFVGGCTTGIFVTDPAAAGIRPTRDVDVMPTDASVLGFSNRWYPMAIDTAQRLDIGGHVARIVTPALFLATKLEAFHGRGNADVFSSHDLEDLVTVVDGRPEIVSDVEAADQSVRSYIASELRSLVGNPDFIEALPGFLLPDAANQARRPILEERLRLLAGTA